METQRQNENGNSWKQDGRTDGACPATSAMSEIVDEGALLPVYEEVRRTPAGR